MTACRVAFSACLAIWRARYAVTLAVVPLRHHALRFMLFIAAYMVIETLLMPAFGPLAGAVAAAGSEATFFGALRAVGALAGCAGYFVGSWLILHRPAFDAWAVFGGVGMRGWIFARVLLPFERDNAPAVR